MDVTTIDAVAETETQELVDTSKKTKKSKKAEKAPPDANAQIVLVQQRILADIDALIAALKGTGAAHQKVVRPFKRTAEDKLRELGWTVLDPKMAVHMTNLNAERAAGKAEREAKAAEEAAKKAQERAMKIKAAAEAKLAEAEARVAALRKQTAPAEAKAEAETDAAA